MGGSVGGLIMGYEARLNNSAEKAKAAGYKKKDTRPVKPWSRTTMNQVINSEFNLGKGRKK